MTAVERFEREFAKWLGVCGAVATGFGRGALWLALEAADVHGSDVLVPEFICPHVVGAVERAGARPVFYRVRRELTISPEDLSAAWTPKTRAAILPHYFGHAMPAIRALVEGCHARRAVAIEDCALAMGARLDGELCGRFGDFAAFSLTKSDWCFGGGVVTANDEVRLAQLRRLQREKLQPARWLCSFYGLLKWADYTANRPRWTRVAERMGRTVQAISGIKQDNFYDAGRLEAAMTSVTARRALRILNGLGETIERRKRLCKRIRESWGKIDANELTDPGDAGATHAFMVFQSGPQAGAAAHQADDHRVTLRRAWPDPLQKRPPTLARGENPWAGLLILEIPPDLHERDVTQIGSCLSKCFSSATPE